MVRPYVICREALRTFLVDRKACGEEYVKILRKTQSMQDASEFYSWLNGARLGWFLS